MTPALKVYTVYLLTPTSSPSRSKCREGDTCFFFSPNSNIYWAQHGIGFGSPGGRTTVDVMSLNLLSNYLHPSLSLSPPRLVHSAMGPDKTITMSSTKSDARQLLRDPGVDTY